MRDLIAITTGVLAFCAWSTACIAIGAIGQARRARRAQLQRLEALKAYAKAAKAPMKVEPTYPPATDAVRRRSHA